jgi:hypothetical protein
MTRGDLMNPTRDQAVKLVLDTAPYLVEHEATTLVDALLNAGLIVDREPRGPRSSDEPRPESADMKGPRRGIHGPRRTEGAQTPPTVTSGRIIRDRHHGD